MLLWERLHRGTRRRNAAASTPVGSRFAIFMLLIRDTGALSQLGRSLSAHSSSTFVVSPPPLRFLSYVLCNPLEAEAEQPVYGSTPARLSSTKRQRAEWSVSWRTSREDTQLLQVNWRRHAPMALEAEFVSKQGLGRLAVWHASHNKSAHPSPWVSWGLTHDVVCQPTTESGGGGSAGHWGILCVPEAFPSGQHKA